MTHGDFQVIKDEPHFKEILKVGPNDQITRRNTFFQVMSSQAISKASLSRWGFPPSKSRSNQAFVSATTKSALSTISAPNATLQIASWAPSAKDAA